jgi:oligopeptide transport system substrate-binding protein
LRILHSPLRRSLLAGLALLALAACGRDESPAESAGTAPPGKADPTTFERGNGPEPDSLDPQRARTDSSMNILRDLFEGLTALDGNASVIPGAAESWTVSADGRRYTFKLREGLRWSNGDPLVAADFVAGMRRLVDPATASQYAQVFEPVRNASAILRGIQKVETLGVSAPDPRTVVIELERPAPYLLGLLSHPSTSPVHGPSLAAHGEAHARPGNLVSNGAFELVDWVIGGQVELRRNRRYWDDAATGVERVRFHHIPDTTAEFRQYRAGQLDVTYVVPPQQFAWIREQLPGELHVSPQLTVYYYGFNLSRPPFKDNPQLRRALSLALDRDRLVQAVTGLGELPAWGWVPASVADYSAQRFEYADWPAEKRIAAAREAYRAAGFSAENPLKIEIRYNSGDLHNRVAVAVAAMWKEALGVQTTLYAEEFRALLQSIEAGTDIQVFRSSWIGDYNDAWTFAQLLQSDFGINMTGYANPQYDSLLRQAADEVDLARRRAALEEAERLMLADHPLLPLYFYVNKHLVKPYVHGWTDNVMNVQYSRRIRLDETADARP